MDRRIEFGPACARCGDAGLLDPGVAVGVALPDWVSDEKALLIARTGDCKFAGAGAGAGAGACAGSCCAADASASISCAMDEVEDCLDNAETEDCRDSSDAED